MLEDGDLLHVDARGRAHVFNVQSLTGSSLARMNLSDLEVKRVGRKIEAEIESVMKVRGVCGGVGVGLGCVWVVLMRGGRTAGHAASSKVASGCVVD
jgi:hypothetical protein